MLTLIKRKLEQLAVLILDKADFRKRKTARDKKGYYTIIRLSILQDDITILNAYASNKRVPKYMRQKLRELQGETGKFTIKVGEFMSKN